jgi:hypothetical protein
MHQLHTLELMRLGVRMLPRTVSRLTSLTRLTFSGEMTRNVPLPDEVLQLTNLKVRTNMVLRSLALSSWPVWQVEDSWQCLAMLGQQPQAVVGDF